MMRLRGLARVGAAVILLPMMVGQQAWAWGIYAHAMLNGLAPQYLPSDVPLFMRDGHAKAVMTFIGPEPDNWRSATEPELNDAQAPDHFIDLEYVPLLGTGPLPKKRYDAIRAIAVAQAAHPEMKLTPETFGMQPWQVEEVYERLKVGFREYRQLVAANKDTRGAEVTVLFYAGWLGHYVEDGSNPMHASMEYNGWTGPNPHGYTTANTIHAQFERYFVVDNIKEADIAPLVAAAPAKAVPDEWNDYLTYLEHSQSLVEKVYQLEKAGALKGAGTPESRAFVEERMAAGAIELRDLIYTAWLRSADPVK